MIVDTFIEFIFGRFCAGLERIESGFVWLRGMLCFVLTKKGACKQTKQIWKQKDVQTSVSAVVSIGVLWIHSRRENSRSWCFSCCSRLRKKKTFDICAKQVRTYSLRCLGNPCQLCLGNPCHFNACFETKQEEMLRDTYNPRISNATSRIRFASKLERRRVRSQAFSVTDAVPCYLAARCL